MIKINTKKYEVTKNGKAINLSLTEYKILCLLSGNQLVTYEDIASRIYGSDRKYYGYAICQRVSQIRKKLKIEISSCMKAGYKTDETIYIEWGKIWNYVQNVPMYSLVDMLIQM